MKHTSRLKSADLLVAEHLGKSEERPSATVSRLIGRKLMTVGLTLSFFIGAADSMAVTEGKYTIGSSPGTVRTTPAGFVIGRMTSTTGHAYVKQPGQNWSWAYNSGAGICGWILNSKLGSRVDGSQFGTCPSGPTMYGVEHRQYLLNNYASEVNDYDPGNLKHHGKRITLNAGSWPVYGNYFNGGIRNKITEIDNSKYVCWRYIAKGSSNRWVLISYASGPPPAKGTWCFISMDAIYRPGYPKTENGIWCNLPHSY